LGKVRPTYVKRIARQIMAEYEQLVTDNFEENKKLLNEIFKGKSKRLRNKVAGYLVRLVKLGREEYVIPTAEERRSEEEYEKEIRKYEEEAGQAEITEEIREEAMEEDFEDEESEEEGEEQEA